MKNLFKLPAALLFVVTLIVAAACSGGSKYEISGHTVDNRELTFRLLIYTPQGVRNELLATRDGYFRYQNKIADKNPLYVEVYTHDYKLIGLAQINPGARIEMTVDPTGIRNYRVADTANDSGDDFNARLTDFIQNNPDLDNKAIESYVENHTDDPLAYALLTTLFNTSDNVALARRLFNELSVEARPLYYDNGFATLLNASTTAPDMLLEAKILTAADTFMTFDPKAYDAVIIAYTLDNETRRDTIAPLLQEVGARIKNKKAIALEHNLTPDSGSWRRTLRNDLNHFKQLNKRDSTRTLKDDKLYWTSVWTGVGPAAPMVREYNITNIPYFIVADSSAQIRYSGPVARHAVDTLYSILKYKE